MKVWQSTELFISGDQRPAPLKCRGRDQAISWIAMLKQGAAGENSDLSRDWQHLQTQGLQQPGEIVNRADIAWKLKAAAIDQEGQLPQRDVGDGEMSAMASWPSCRPFSRAAAALALRRDRALAQNRGMGVSQMS